MKGQIVNNLGFAIFILFFCISYLFKDVEYVNYAHSSQLKGLRTGASRRDLALGTQWAHP